MRVGVRVTEAGGPVGRPPQCGGRGEGGFDEDDGGRGGEKWWGSGWVLLPYSALTQWFLVRCALAEHDFSHT